MRKKKLIRELLFYSGRRHKYGISFSMFVYCYCSMTLIYQINQFRQKKKKIKLSFRIIKYQQFLLLYFSISKSFHIRTSLPLLSLKQIKMEKIVKLKGKKL